MVGNLEFYGKKMDKEHEPLVGRICYVFNTNLTKKLNDTICTHCAKFMTLECEHIDEFVGDDGD